jgi:hypothetical protein
MASLSPRCKVLSALTGGSSGIHLERLRKTMKLPVQKWFVNRRNSKSVPPKYKAGTLMVHHAAGFEVTD